MPFNSPNYTQVPNELLGDQAAPGLMATMSDTELRIVLALCRLTYGFHRVSVEVTVPSLMRMTGHRSPRSVQAGLASAQARGLIEAVERPGQPTIWRIKPPDTPAEICEDPPQISADVDAKPPDTPAEICGGPPQISADMKEIKKTNTASAGADAASPLHRQLKALWGARRLNGSQIALITDLEKAYPHARVIEAATWAHTKGMTFGTALLAIKKALPNWGKGSGNDRHSDNGRVPGNHPRHRIADPADFYPIGLGGETMPEREKPS